MPNPSLRRTPPLTSPNRVAFLTRANLGGTPTYAGDNHVSSTNLDHTQREIKSSLWGRVLTNEPGIVTHVIKPHLVDSEVVDAIKQTLVENPELKAACNLLFKNVVAEKDMYMPMVSARIGYC